METLDDHDGWGDSDVSAEQAEEITKRTLNKAAERTSAGNIPGDVQKALDKLNNSVVPWRNVLQRFVAKCLDMHIDSSRKRRSRRFGLVHPGTIKEPKLRLGIAIDTSGSVGDKYLTQFFTEVNKIYSMGIEIYVVQADTEVQVAEEYSPKKPIVVKGRGGTAFQPAIDALEKIECDGILYFTDGCTDGEIPKSKKPILWGLCPPYEIPSGWNKKHTVNITLKEDK
jgi:predicted metal-dependent peptidase